jgi:hypothetical protein
MTATLTKLDLSTLREDGDTLTLDDGRVLKLKIEVDQDTSINDFDFYGTVERYCHRYVYGEGRSPRPENFTGNAEKIQVSRGEWIWWEPPTDVKRTDPNFKALHDNVRDILEYGFNGVILQLCEGKDYYGKLVVVNDASLWGIDSLDNGYIHEVVRELASELEVV